jgi:hypothetical protein
MKRRSYRQLLQLQRRHFGRAFYLEERGYRVQATRLWSAADRVTRVIETWRSKRASADEGVPW